jgi:hypothetical protein
MTFWPRRLQATAQLRLYSMPDAFGALCLSRDVGPLNTDEHLAQDTG